MRYDLDGVYTLMSDLDFNNANDYRNSAFKDFFTTNLGWLQIGDNSIGNKFTGIFNGNNYVIKNLFIDRDSPATNYIGLISTMDTGSIVEKLGLENVNIAGYGDVGGIAGYNQAGTIRNSYVTGTVLGLYDYVGGIAGNNAATITNTYSTANITGNSRVGGLIGISSGNAVTNSFSTGNVAATISSGAYYGRLIGYTSGSPTNNYYSGGSTLTGTGTIDTTGTSSTTAAIQPLTLAGLSTWDTTNIWKVNSEAYPTFK
jgi:hypothetical protein